jgi:hypothetical protein
VRHDVLDLGGEAERDARVLRVQRPRDPQRVRRPVEKIGIAEVDVTRAGRDLRARVLQHDLRRHGEETALVDGRDRTVPAQVLAAARRLDVAGDALFAGDRQPCVLRERGQRAPVRHQRGAAAGGRGSTATAAPAAIDAASSTSCSSQSGPSTLCASAARSARFSVA